MDLLIFAGLAAGFALLLSPPLRRSDLWSATMTPLASIIGSGFLVSVPLLAGTVGIWALGAVVGLLLLAYLIGGAVRYNIQYGEPIFDAHHARAVASLETLSHWVLTAAYFISVAYYLSLLATFGLRLAGQGDPLLGKIIATAFVAFICGIGFWRGLSGIEKAEKITVSANLATIGALLAALVLFAFTLPDGVTWTAAAEDQPPIDVDTIRTLAGLLIIVQGFETSRFMGELHDRPTRIAAMKRAQIASAVIYIVFFALMVPLFPFFASETDIAGVLDVLKRVSPWLPFVVAGGAIASQFSAAVADSIGASGLISATSHKRISSDHAYLLIGVIAVVVIWGTDVVSVVTLASRAFALFYALQCAVAASIAQMRRAEMRAAWYGTLAALCLVVVIFGIPASG